MSGTQGRDGRVLPALPYCVMAVVAVAELATPTGFGLLPLISLGPAFAGLVGSKRRTARIGALAVLLCAGLSAYDGTWGRRRVYIAAISVAGVTAAGLAAVALRERRDAELASVRSIAEVAQRVLLRPVPRVAGELRVAVSYTSAVAQARIGGDLYEVVVAAGGTRAVIGDVQGKGLEAVETAALVLGAFREAAHDEPELAGLGRRLERAVDRELRGERFVSALLVEVPAGGREVTFLNFGHPAPLIARPDGTTLFPEPPAYALPLGLNVPGGDRPVPYTVPFTPGDQILLYTDGVSEARDGAGDFYPLAERVSLLKDPDAEAALERLRTDLVDHAAGPLHDDAAMLLLRHRSAP
ncbi:serine/threonine-protein phosphatase [Streptomyces sp. SID14478]|uniref:PP2C family protein-serine/threonine phosphatase n=1 Tax=Streptomyces sp. SID14478 TaxID=2706073 RepID=UPI0013DECE8B|nr:PP2C family protein-serine/threonine phosphatase [Streptomyces sp. SID14478]NEB81554.1 serine/threonine-protein phosphatase [Streptomyces sp. SID14478]